MPSVHTVLQVHQVHRPGDGINRKIVYSHGDRLVQQSVAGKDKMDSGSSGVEMGWISRFMYAAPG